MSEVTNLDEFRPHITVETADNKVHVVPVSLVVEWSNSVYKVPADILKVIITDWLDSLNRPD